jgi:hypothetical protein
VFSHVVKPQEESHETNNNKELVEPKSEERHEAKYAFEQVAEEVPECVHLLLKFVRKYRRNSEFTPFQIHFSKIYGVIQQGSCEFLIENRDSGDLQQLKIATFILRMGRVKN